MKKSILRIATATLFGTVVATMASTSQAGWGSLGGSYGGSSGGASFGGSSGYAAGYGSSGGSYGSYGSAGTHFTPVRSLLRGIHDHMAAKVQRHHARRASYASYGSSGYGSSGYGSSGGWGSSGGYGASYGSSGGYSYGSVGSSVSYGSSGSVSYYSPSSETSVDTAYRGASETSLLANLTSNQQFSDDAVYLSVSVPSNASLYVNGKATTSTGSVRQFVSRGLIPGKSYKFEVRAELLSADGQTLVEEQSVVVTAGGQEQMQFAFADAAAPVETSLTLHLPEEAKVTLAGNTTRASGTQRTYQSNHLKVGQAWDDYLVEVEYQGQVKRQSIRLIGGDNLELSFNFDDASLDRLAANR